MRKYLRIKEAILADIASGTLKVGDQLPVRRELVKKYDVTLATLNRAVAELIGEGRLEATRRSGTFVSKPNRKLKVALVSSFRGAVSFKEPFSHYRVDALRDVIFTCGLEGMRFIDAATVDANLDPLSAYDAVVWLLPNERAMRALSVLKHKVIVVNRYGEEFSFVSTNHRGALDDMTSHFIEKHGDACDLVYLDVADGTFVNQERGKGFIDACARTGMPYRVCRVTRDFEENVGVLGKLKFKSGKLGVVVSPTSSITGAVLRMGYERGMTPEKDFIYSDFDGEDSLRATGLRIPTILQDYKLMGDEVVKAAAMTGGACSKIFIPHKLVNVTS